MTGNQEARVLKTSQTTITTKGIVSDANTSEIIGQDELKNDLGSAGNNFAKHFSMPYYPKIFLPKDSRLAVTSNMLSIVNPVFTLTINIDSGPQMIINANPRTNVGGEMAGAKPRYTTYIYQATLKTEINKFLSGHVNKAKYEAWFARLNASIKEWFEVPVCHAPFNQSPG